MIVEAIRCVGLFLFMLFCTVLMFGAEWRTFGLPLVIMLLVVAFLETASKAHPDEKLDAEIPSMVNLARRIKGQEAKRQDEIPPYGW